MGVLYDAFAKQYHDLSNEQSQKDLNELYQEYVHNVSKSKFYFTNIEHNRKINS